jgi:hypothetical protein
MRGIGVEGYKFSYMRNIPCENGISLLLSQTGIFISFADRVMLLDVQANDDPNSDSRITYSLLGIFYYSEKL